MVEARPRPGGRIHSIVNALESGLAAELGGEAFDSDHVACLSLAQSLGLPIVDLWQQGPTAGSDLFWFRQRRGDGAALLAEFTTFLRARHRDWQAVQQFMQTGAVTPAIATLDMLSISDYLARGGVSEALYQAATTAYTIKYGMEAAAQSSLNLLSYFANRGDCESWFGQSDERYYLRGGNQQLPMALYTHVRSQVQLSTQLEAVTAQPDGQYRVTLKQGNTVGDRLYSAVVLTLPFSVLRHLPLNIELPLRQRQAIDQLCYSTPVKMFSAYHHPVWRDQGWNGLVYTDLPVHHCWEASDSVLAATGALLVTYPGGRPGDRPGGTSGDRPHLTHQSRTALSHN